MSSILRDTENNFEYHLFHPTAKNLNEAQPCSRGEGGGMLMQPALWFKEGFVIYGREAFTDLLKNVFPEEKWTEMEVLMFLSEAAEEMYGGFMGVMMDILSDSRVMVGISHFGQNTKQEKIIRRIVTVPGERNTEGVAENILFPWRDNEGTEFITATAVKNSSCPIVLLPISPSHKAWVRFDKDCTFISRKLSRLQAFPRVGRSSYAQPITQDQLEICHSKEIISLQKLNPDLFL